MIEEKRKTKDRRKRPTRPISKYTLVGRRKKSRREEEADNYYADKYERKYLIIIGLIVLLAIFDTIFSLKIFKFGGSEINPIMSFLLKTDVTFALIIKYLATILAILVIFIHKNFRVLKFIKTNSVIYFILIIHIVLFIYESYFLFSLGLRQ